MSTKSSLHYSEDKFEHRLEIHIYKEMHDGLTYLNIKCTTCNSEILVPISGHMADVLIRKLEI
jgi:hypothetical protein